MLSCFCCSFSTIFFNVAITDKTPCSLLALELGNGTELDGEDVGLVVVVLGAGVVDVVSGASSVPRTTETLVTTLWKWNQLRQSN